MTILPETKRTPREAPPGDDFVHGVCGCQVDADPRTAVCGSDCTDGPQGPAGSFWSRPCIVCLDLYLTQTPCRRCGWAPW